MIGKRIALGTVQFGIHYGISNINKGRVDQTEVEVILDYAKLSEIKTLDTAISYGESEDSLGKAGVDNWDVVTKLPKLPSSCTDIFSWVESQVTESLSRLKISKVYGLLLHCPMQLTESVGVDLWCALQKVKHIGLVDKIGFSISSPGELDTLWPLFKPDLVQVPYNVIDRRFEESGWLRCMYKNSVEVHVRSIFLQGLLILPKEDRPLKFDPWKNLWTRWDKWLNSENITAQQACLRFALSNQYIDKVVIGVDNIEQLKQILSSSLEPLLVPEEFSEADLNLINPSHWSLL